MEKLKGWARMLLKKSESIFKTDMVYVARSGFWLGLGQFLYAVLAFVLSLFFANVVAKDVYGTYKYILSLASLLGALTLTGMGNVIIQAIAQGAEGVYKDAVRVTLRWSSIMSAAAIVLAVYYFYHHNYIIGISMIAAALALPIINTYGLYGSYLSGKKDFRSITLYGVISQAVINGGIILTTFVTKTVLPIVLVYFALNSIVTLVGYRVTLKKYRPNTVHDETLIPYGKHLSVMSFLGTLANQLDKVLVYHFLGAVPLAVYAFAQAIPDQAKGLLKNIFTAALPKYAELSEEAMRQSVKKKSAQLTLLTLIMIVVYILLAPWIFHYLFPRYMEAVPYSQIYIIPLITIPTISLLATYFQLQKSLHTMYVLNIVGNIATLIFSFVLIYRYGLWGAVVENGVSWLFLLGLHMYYFHKEKPATTLNVS